MLYKKIKDNWLFILILTITNIILLLSIYLIPYLGHSSFNNKIDISYNQNKAYSTIIIKDYGDGIAKNEISHIFERFYKGKNSSPDSIGIGLALSKAIIENDNGVINVESNKKGTKFIIKYFNL